MRRRRSSDTASCVSGPRPLRIQYVYPGGKRPNQSINESIDPMLVGCIPTEIDPDPILFGTLGVHSAIRISQNSVLVLAA
jgi:hypothetical protein